MLTHLISTTEFVKLVKDNSTSLTERSIANQYIQCLRYANFISQKPTKELLREYIKNINNIKFNKTYIIINIADDCHVYIDKENNDVFYSSEMYYIKTLEDLVEFIKLELTETALKQIL